MIADLAGRVAFVTGAGSGIGLATVECLLEEGAGVEATDLRANGLNGLAEASPERLQVSSLDVTDRVGVRNAVEAAAESSLPVTPSAKPMNVPTGTAAWPSICTARSMPAKRPLRICSAPTTGRS